MVQMGCGFYCVQQIGTVQGKYQPDGILGYIGDDYILEPLGGQKAVTFSVPENCDTSHYFVVPGKAFNLKAKIKDKNNTEKKCFHVSSFGHKSGSWSKRSGGLNRNKKCLYIFQF